MKWNKNNIVVKSNKLNGVQQEQLSMIEQRVLQLAIIDANHKLLEGQSRATVSIHASQYAEIFNVARTSSYDALMDAAEKLGSRTFTFEEDIDSGKKKKWVTDIKYIKTQGVLELKLSRAVLGELPKNDDIQPSEFVSYDINDISEITSSFTFRIFEILSQYKSSGKSPHYSLQRLRGMLGLEDGKYLRMTDFKRVIINKPLETINKLVDMNADYEQTKEGRDIASIQFIIKKEKPKKKRATKKATPEAKVASDAAEGVAQE